MIENWNDAVVRGIAAAENELIVRDFLDVWSTDARFLEPFFHHDVVYSAASTQTIRGRRDVVRMCLDVRAAFCEHSTRIVSLAVVGATVLTEQRLSLGLLGHPTQEVVSFASYEIRDHQIMTWTQLHG